MALSKIEQEVEIEMRWGHDPMRRAYFLNAHRYGHKAAERMHALAMTRLARNQVWEALVSYRRNRTPDRLSDLQMYWTSYRNEMSRYSSALRKKRFRPALMAE